MAKKKKAQKVNSNNGVATARITQHPTGYKGVVTVKIQKGGYTLKTIKATNSGTVLLFNGIARFLSGHSDLSGYIPQYLGIGCQDTVTATDPLQTRLVNEYDLGPRITLNKGNIRIDTDAHTVLLPFTANILYSTIGSRRITELGLFSTLAYNDDTLLARVNIVDQNESGTPGITLDVGMNLTVEWNIVLQNIS